MRNRRAQTRITDPSEFLAAKTKQLKRGGESHAVTVEPTIAGEPASLIEVDPKAGLFSFLKDLRAGGGISLSKRRYASIADFDAQEYDERGNPR